MNKIVYLYPHGLQGGEKIALAEKFAKGNKIINLFGSFHISKEDMEKAEAMMTNLIDKLVDNGEKVKIVLVGFSPLVAVLYGWYIKNVDDYPEGSVTAVYYIKELKSDWEEVTLP